MVKRNKTRKVKAQKGGDLCKEDTSSYEYDTTIVLGQGAFGTVYGIKGDPKLAAKVQKIPTTRGWLNKFIGKEEEYLFHLQNELAIATLAGELGVGPRIYYLAMCDKKKDRIIWVMDRIQNGDTVYNILEKYKKDLKKEGKSKSEIKELELKKRQAFHDELLDMLEILENKNVKIVDIHGGNLMYGSIDGGEPRLWIIDYGGSYFKKPRKIDELVNIHN